MATFIDTDRIVRMKAWAETIQVVASVTRRTRHAAGTTPSTTRVPSIDSGWLFRTKA